MIENAGGAVSGAIGGKMPTDLGAKTGAKAGGLLDGMFKGMSAAGAQLLSSVMSAARNIFGEWSSLAWGVVTMKKGLPDMVRRFGVLFVELGGLQVETVVQVGLESFFKVGTRPHSSHCTASRCLHTRQSRRRRKLPTPLPNRSTFSTRCSNVSEACSGPPQVRTWPPIVAVHLGPIETLKAVLPSEIKVIKASMEKGWTSANAMIASLGSRTPVTSRLVAPSFHAMQTEFAKQRHALPAASNNHLSKVGHRLLCLANRRRPPQMIVGLKDAQAKVGKAISTTTPQSRKELGVVFNVIKNFHMRESPARRSPTARPRFSVSYKLL